MDASTADKEDFEVGDTVTVAAGGPKKQFKLVGLATIGQSAGLGGATFVVFDLATAQALFDKRNKVDFAFVAAKPGVSDADLQRRVASILPPTAQVRTAAQEADKAGDDIREGLSFLTTGLLAFAFIAVLVGAFLIFNTFSITVAQRARELALLRTLGATRRQVLNSVLLEALTIGVLGSIAGIVAGLGFATAINELFKALGIDLPTTGLVLESRTIIVCLLVGTIVTLLGALAPAVRATRVAPVEALRESERAHARAAGAAHADPRRPVHPRRRRARRRGPARRGRRHLDQAARRRGRRGDPHPRHRADLAALRRPRGARRRRAGRAHDEARRDGSHARTPRVTPAARR